MNPEMADLHPLSGVVSLRQAGGALAHPVLDLGVTRALPHMVLKLSAPDSRDLADRWPVPVVSAMHRLVTTIADLRSPASGWPDDLPQTPDAIAPYVSEELEDVVAALKDHPPLPDIHEVGAAEYQLLHDLEPWLIWCIARSGYEIMRLLEGVSAQVQLPDQEMQSGIVRLCALLDVKTPEWSCALDLVTHESPRLLLPADAWVQSHQFQLCRHAVDAGRLLQGIMAQVRSTTPAIGSFLNGLATEMLVPLKSWQDGSIQLHLGLEFVKNAVDTSADRLIAPEVAVVPDSPDAAAQPASETPLIRFTEGAWLANYSQAIAQHQLATLLAQSPIQQPLREASTASDIANLLLSYACDLSSHWNGSLTLASRNFPAQSLGLDELALRILWCFSRSSSDVLRWLGGVPVSVLQPGYPWEQGTLRLRATLKVSTPTVDWHLDLATGQTPEPFIPPSLDGVVRSPHVSWCAQPQPLRALHNHLWQQLQRTTPELLLLVQSTSVDLLGFDHDWQNGMLQVQADLELIPEMGISPRTQTEH